MTTKQKKFVQNYLIHLNATRAALEAGYSKESAYSIGHENLKKPEIKKMIEEQILHESLTASMVRHTVINELIKISFSSQENKASIRLKALELLCRVYKVFDPEEKSHNPSVPNKEQLKVMSKRLDEYLARYHKKA